jgi:transcriptional regulator with XRE-family HTH domain
MRVWLLNRALELLEREGRTKKWLAEYCRINLQSLNHYLSGRRIPPRPIVRLIAQALNSTEGYLMGEDESESHPAEAIAAAR